MPVPDFSENLTIRRFKEEDASFCYRIRREAFLNLFVDEVGEEAALAGANA